MPPIVYAQQAQQVTELSLSVWDAVDVTDCQDRMTFLSVDEVLVESGSHTSIKSYKLVRERRSDFYSLRFNTKSRNKQPTCAGKLGTVAGQDHGTYIKFNEAATEMTFYSAPENGANFNLIFKRR